MYGESRGVQGPGRILSRGAALEPVGPELSPEMPPGPFGSFPVSKPLQGQRVLPQPPEGTRRVRLAKRTPDLDSPGTRLPETTLRRPKFAVRQCRGLQRQNLAKLGPSGLFSGFKGLKHRGWAFQRPVKGYRDPKGAPEVSKAVFKGSLPSKCL